MPQLTFVSLFAGIGGIDLGLERAGHECVGQVEIDPFCLKVLEKHWPDAPRWTDIRELDGSELPEADLWTAGFPCQDISNAGRRAGIRGERSGVFFDLMRLVRQVRPRYLLLENVAALLVRGMGDVLGELAQSGYDAEWDCIPAWPFGSPESRTRVFIMAHAHGHGGIQHSVYAGAKLEATPTEHRRRVPDWPGQWRPERSDIAGVRLLPQHRDARDDGRLPDRLDRCRVVPNAVVPQVGEYIGWLLMEMPERYFAGKETKP